MNEVQNAYNDFAQLETQYQEHAGAVNTGTTPKVEYAYEDGSANTIRPTAMTYPAGQVLENLYDDADADNLSRIRTLNFDEDDVAQYSYLGLGTFVTTAYPQPQIKLDYANGFGVNPYSGFDQFGRIIDLLWQSYTTGTSSSSSSSSGGEPPGLMHLQYTYDRASNRISRADLIAQWYGKDFDELYEYDGMHRLKKFHRGRLVESDTVIESPTLQQGWRLDATGNWRNFTQNDQADPANTLDQQRLSNRVNEITQIARTVGANWVTPEYDRNGNMAVIPQPKEPTLAYRGTWDAWNRLVKLEEPYGDDGWQTLQENSYDGQTWRITRKDYEGGSHIGTCHLYYTSQWQDIEERLEGESTPNQQYVWGIRYLDDLIQRNRNLRRVTIRAAGCKLECGCDMFDSKHWSAIVFAYFAYGREITLTESFELAAQTNWECMYTGQCIDFTSRLYTYRERVYHPLIGTFTSRDPIGYDQYMNLYQYTYSNPATFTDYSGLVPYGPCTTTASVPIPCPMYADAACDAHCRSGLRPYVRGFTGGKAKGCAKQTKLCYYPAAACGSVTVTGTHFDCNCTSKKKGTCICFNTDPPQWDPWTGYKYGGCATQKECLSKCKSKGYKTGVCSFS